MRSSLALLALLSLVGPFTTSPAVAEDVDPAAELRTLLDGYDHRSEGEMVDTIPIEKAILAVADAGKADALVAFAAHERFGALAFVVACEAREVNGGKDAKALKAQEGLHAAFVALAPPARADLAVSYAALRSDVARAALAALAVEAEVKDAPALAARVRSARLRVGDPAVLAEAKKALASKDPDKVAQTLLSRGDSRSPDFVLDLARFVGDARKLKTALASAWPTTKTTTSADGLTTTSEQVPVPLPTVGDVALEAASRLCATPLPGWVAWWAWPEKGPRFERGPAGVAALRALSVWDGQAAMVYALRAVPAVAAVLDHVRRTGEEGVEARILSAVFDKTWTVTLTVAGEKRTAVVDAAGKVVLK